MSINEIVKKLRRLNRCEQIHFLRAELRKESQRSIRRQELEGMLRDSVTKQLKRETRVA